MKLVLSTITLALAALTSAQYDIESQSFRLVLSSADTSVNGQTLSACHSGAAIESLCLSGTPSTSKPTAIAAANFRFNTSSSIQTPPGGAAPGILVYELPTSPPTPSALEFFYDPTTNYALPLFFPGQGAQTQTLVFDSSNKLAVQGYVNYSTNPPTSGATTNYYRWYSCPTYFSGYTYVNLVWTLGDVTPVTPGCAKVDVKRVFI